MSTLVDDLLLHARHEVPDDRSEVIDLAEVVELTVDEFTLPAGERSIAVVAQAEPVLVCGDRSALRRALANLVANAVRLAPQDSTVRVASSQAGERALLSVAEEGPGIAAKDQPSVFQRFWRGDASEAQAEGRSGLGLAIVRQIAEGHGGSVALVSAAGEGSTFTLSLPIAQETRRDQPEQNR